MARVVLYARAATHDGRLDAAAQLAELRARAAERGWEVVGEFADEVAGPSAERPGLDAAVAAIRRGDAGTLAAVALDRIARSAQHVLDTVRAVAACHGAVVCTRDAFDSSTPDGRTMAHGLAAAVALQRALDGERRAAKRKPGARPGRPRKFPDAALARALDLYRTAEVRRALDNWAGMKRTLASEGLGRWHTATIRSAVLRANAKASSRIGGS